MMGKILIDTLIVVGVIVLFYFILLWIDGWRKR